MPEYKIRNPDYIGLWIAPTYTPRNSLFIAYVSKRDGTGERISREGKMVDSVGIAKFNSVLEGNCLKLRKKYIPGLSQNRASEIIVYECRLNGSLFEGECGKPNCGCKGKVFMTDFEKALKGEPNNLADRLIRCELEGLMMNLIEKTNQFPFSPPIPEALEKV